MYIFINLSVLYDHFKIFVVCSREWCLARAFSREWRLARAFSRYANISFQVLWGQYLPAAVASRNSYSSSRSSQCGISSSSSRSISSSSIIYVDIKVRKLFVNYANRTFLISERHNIISNLKLRHFKKPAKAGLFWLKLAILW